MTPRDWRRAGYRTILREGRVYLFRPATEEVIEAPAGGDWADHPNLNAAPWRRWQAADLTARPDLLADFRATAATCGCDRDGVELCDFCAGRRRSPWLG